MKALADEGLDRQIVERLRRDGHDVSYVAELRPGLSDDEVFADVNRDGRLLITADKDFGELVYHRRLVTHGVLLVRLAGLGAEAKAARVATALARHGDELLGSFSVITPGAVRIRRPTQES